MRKFWSWIVIVVLLVFNGILFWQTHTLRQTLREITGDEADFSILEGYVADARGVYTLPTIGQYFMPPDSTGSPPPSLSLVIFFSSKTSCPWSLAEIDVFKRLLPEFQSRGQQVVSVCAPEDSLEIAHLLDSASFDAPLVPVAAEQFTFRQMGISPGFMPFKVFFDSTYTAIYMRGSDNTPESQLVFEAAAKKLSQLAAEGAI